MNELNELAILKEKLRLQTQLDDYKDDLIETQVNLLDAKDKLIAELRGVLNND